MRRVMRFLGQKDAQKVDEELMSEKFGFSVDQLMELAGLSVASALAKEYPCSQVNGDVEKSYANVLVVAGPGNNGGDALVAARHLKHFGYSPAILYPKQSSKPLFKGLVTQCNQLEIPFMDSMSDAASIDTSYDVILDGIFGFSFSGDIRPPFDDVVSKMKQCKAPIVSIDIPSGWHVEQGNESGAGLDPTMLVSLTAPKLCAQHFHGPGKAHYIGGRFVPKSLANAFNLDIPTYPGIDQCVKVD